MADAMKCLVIVLWALIPLTPQAQTAGGKHEQRNDAGISQDKESRESRGGCPAVIQQQTCYPVPGEQKGQSQTANNATNPRNWVEYINASSTAVIAIFTILLFVGVLWQIRTNRDIERAWIIVNPIEHAPAIVPIPETGDPLDDAHQPKRNIFAASIKNTGNTPAKLLESKMAYRQAASLKDIPAKPCFGPRLDYGAMLLVKGDSIGELVFLEPSPIVTKAVARAVQRQEVFWYAFGVVL